MIFRNNLNSINRNILECKDVSQNRKIIVKSVLIETYWNVKYYEMQRTKINFRRINRNILECKGVTSTDGRVRKSSINRNILECKEELRSNRERGLSMY